MLEIFWASLNWNINYIEEFIRSFFVIFYGASGMLQDIMNLIKHGWTLLILEGHSQEVNLFKWQSQHLLGDVCLHQLYVTGTVNRVIVEKAKGLKSICSCLDSAFLVQSQWSQLLLQPLQCSASGRWGMKLCHRHSCFLLPKTKAAAASKWGNHRGPDLSHL